MLKLGKIDAELLRALEKDSRVSYTKLARQLKISDVAVKKRVEKLKKNGVIKRFTIEVDPAIGGEKIRAFVLIKSEANKIKEIIDELKKSKLFSELYSTLGEYEIVGKINAGDIEELKKNIEKKINLIDGVLEVKTNIIFTEN